MNPPPRSLSLAHIHSVYSSGTVKPERTAEEASPNYKTTNRFAREASHSGVAPNRPSSPIGRPKR